MKPKPINIAGPYLKKFKWLLPVLTLPALIYGYWRWVNLPVDPKNQTEQVFVVPQGQPTSIIAERLFREKLIKSALAFRVLAEQKGYSGKLQAGDFRLNRAMSLEVIADNLTHGSLDFWITFPEGLRAEEYAERLAGKSAINQDEFILAAKPYEGQLFPDTYLIPNTAAAEDVVTLLTKTFVQKSPTHDKRVLIIASLIEREAKHNDDRKLVSSVVHNRLKIGMALQIDATVQYALGKPGKWWPQDLIRENLQLDSPYNTYLNPGLPPAPIANPGLASLRAAAGPAETEYLYYVSDDGGYNHYATTLAGHQANIAKYLPLDN
ncbi:aminodeoxychorismate lyase [Candidatus Beckwithbacteria bacterium CG22_combo_CG10-13_8_21_14_all_01_47_9]|uniref:Endolytic murein transglycosylase n=3 Tax=Candidatus Beckwithiibacteriota TaxID=1752726 RepID=A0A2H0E0I8_9BACT|nr:MAG: aminodeoxychorismate lyase [Candidatus Beckwithbacteria bacterium CG22_combo_CG10-13_8_21_14_all_01_47_9]PJA21163.1 MAG: endolytic transglycosylase MltG [Candidatus Beckwithbacteria bacterium CG_4_10_14_0_2_um_filter_47_25]PJC66303.1 MAG: endolytic transglycosylase MltG [Candidatus Beckwithbacteria bacterium CG_4_9_14_0_2_um_filter_47_11]